MSRRSLLFQNIGTDFNKNFQEAVQKTFHSIEAYKPGYLLSKEYTDWRNQNLKRFPNSKPIFDDVEKLLPKEDNFQTDQLILHFSRYGRNVYDKFIRVTMDEDELMHKMEGLNRVLIGIDESTDPRRSQATLTLEVVRFHPEVDFKNKFKGVTDNLRVKFMFENQIKDTEKLTKEDRKVAKVVLSVNQSRQRPEFHSGLPTGQLLVNRKRSTSADGLRGPTATHGILSDSQQRQ